MFKKVMTMKNSMKWSAWMLLGGMLVFGLPSCGDDDDPNYNNVTPPTVTIATHGISGMVTAISGDPISGATITATAAGKSFTAQTGADGSYTIGDVNATGKIELTAAADGKQAAAATVEIPSDGKAHQVAANFVLANVAQEVAFTGEAQEVAVEIEKPNVVAAEDAVTMTMAIPAGAAEGKMEITPIYAGADNSGLRAAQQMTVGGLSLAAVKDNGMIKEAIGVSVDLGAEVASACKVMNGDVEVASKVKGGILLFDVTGFGVYRIVSSIDISTKTSTEKISVSGNFDNLYGAADLTVDAVNYTYKVGGKIDAPKGKSAAFAYSILSGIVNVSTVKEMTGSYPLNLVLPIGTAASVSGAQAVETTTVSCFGSSLSATKYGAVALSISTYNRQHTGGSIN